MNTLALILLTAAVVAALLGFVLRRHAPANAGAPLETRGPFVPDPNNDKALLVQGCSADELKKILADFARMYQEDSPDFKYLMRNEGGFQRVAFPSDLKPRLLSFLVNYVKYPIGFDLSGRNVLSVGIATVKPDFGAPTPALGQRAVFYIPIDDRDHDLVYIAVGDHTYRQSFTDMRWTPTEDRRMAAKVEMLAK